MKNFVRTLTAAAFFSLSYGTAVATTAYAVDEFPDVSPGLWTSFYDPDTGNVIGWLGYGGGGVFSLQFINPNPESSPENLNVSYFRQENHTQYVYTDNNGSHQYEYASGLEYDADSDSWRPFDEGVYRYNTATEERGADAVAYEGTNPQEATGYSWYVNNETGESYEHYSETIDISAWYFPNNPYFETDMPWFGGLDLASSWLDFEGDDRGAISLFEFFASASAMGVSQYGVTLAFNESEFLYGGGSQFPSILAAALVYNTPAVPEPETYAMLLAGLGLVGVVARRRRHAAAGR
ncbi:MAG: PEP-CTERM sorting domain-containing protein [Azoarcus sp.]|jgi:hypothetical protein|nr:PEP-CTERM sorting domain-containing protein [Azoarcus sp.]